jgi:hypothetical protein
LSLRMNKCLERVYDRHFWNPGVFSYAMIPRCRPNSRVFFVFIVQSIVYCAMLMTMREGFFYTKISPLDRVRTRKLFDNANGDDERYSLDLNSIWPT